MEIKKILFDIHGDERGTLVAIEENLNIPFDIKRVYYLLNTTEGTRRGFHSHVSLEQVLITTSGSCTIHLDDGYETAEVVLDNPREGLYVPPYYWHEMYDFSPDCVLMVIANGYYNEDDYVRDYDKFLSMRKSEGLENE